MKSKDRFLVLVLTFLFGGIGIHRLYLGQITNFVLMLLFSWTFIPTLIAIYDFIRFILMSDKEFEEYCRGGSN